MYQVLTPPSNNNVTRMNFVGKIQLRCVIMTASLRQVIVRSKLELYRLKSPMTYNQHQYTKHWILVSPACRVQLSLSKENIHYLQCSNFIIKDTLTLTQLIENCQRMKTFLFKSQLPIRDVSCSVAHCIFFGLVA